MKTSRLTLAVAALALAGAAHCQDAGVGAAAPAAAPAKGAAARGQGRPARPAPASGAGWRVMGEEEMRGATAKGLAPVLFGAGRPRPLAGPRNGPGHAGLPLGPVLGLLSADTQATDVIYGAGGAAPVWHRDGSVTLALPERVGAVEAHNIRANAADASSFGSVRINAIDLGRTTITLSPK